MCTDKNIQELLPAFLRRTLGAEEEQLVKNHLKTCEDCRAEAALCNALLEEQVPDPGEAFWNHMPNRIYRAVQAEKSAPRRSDLARLLESFPVLRWVLSSAAAGLVLTLSWFVVQAPQNPPLASLPQDYAVIAETTGAEAVHISELDQDQLAVVTSWAGREFAALTDEALLMSASLSEADLVDDIAELDAREIDALNAMLAQWKKEG